MRVIFCPIENIANAERHIQKNHTFIKKAPIMRTKPIGYAKQSDFLNTAFLVETDMELLDFNEYLKSVEGKLKRIKTGNVNGPRTIDMDIVVWNERIVDKDIHQRDFLKQSVLELLPNLDF